MSLQIIGAGFGRTGTLSLTAAVEMLGFGPSYHMLECFGHGEKHFRLWEQAAAGNPDWDTLFSGYHSTMDFPACTSWRELADYYPEAKVLLSVRDPDRWFQSTQDTIFAPDWIEYLPTSPAAAYMEATINSYFNGRMHDRDHLIARFEEHVAEIQATIAPERLLTYEVGEGWEPLCEFLGVPVPPEEFPRINAGEETRGIIDNIMANGFGVMLKY